MATISTAPNEVDRKLHRIVLDSNPAQLTNMAALARFIEEEKHIEFSYSRAGKTEFSSANTIKTYVSYARAIGLLDGDLAPTQLKKDIRSLENFQQWLSNAVVQYLTDNNSAIPQIATVIQASLQNVPYTLPTPQNVYEWLKSPPPAPTFKLSLKIISLLRSSTLQVRSRRVILIPGAIED